MESVLSDGAASDTECCSWVLGAVQDSTDSFRVLLDQSYWVLSETVLNYNEFCPKLCWIILSTVRNCAESYWILSETVLNHTKCYPKLCWIILSAVRDSTKSCGVLLEYSYWVVSETVLNYTEYRYCTKLCWIILSTDRNCAESYLVLSETVLNHNKCCPKPWWITLSAVRNCDESLWVLFELCWITVSAVWNLMNHTECCRRQLRVSWEL